MKIWVDDIRTRPGWDWIQAWSSSEAILFLENHRDAGLPIEIMSLDHDLGGDDTTRPIVLWMCENNFWPVEVRVHSANPVGVEWLVGMIERYQPVGNEKCSDCHALLLTDGSHATNDSAPCYGAPL